MQGKLVALDRGQCRGTVKNLEGEELKYTLYFGNPSNMSGLQIDDVLEYQVVVSKSGNPYAKFVRKVDRDNSEHKLTNYPAAAEAKGFELYKSVSAVNALIATVFSDTPEFQTIFVKGEVTNYSGSPKKHYYFAIKDADSKIDCIMWDYDAATGLKFKLESGQQVAIIGRFAYYEKTGTCTLHAKQILNIGDGAEAAALAALKAKLEEEGLFDEKHKKPIPKHPRKVGIVTSKSGQAIRDIVATTRLRKSNVQLYLYSVNVQGKDAVKTVLEGIKALDQMGLDTIIVGRGGGSDEELKFYNEEIIVRTVFQAVTPIISAVGHEGHVPLIDLVADMRASTPTQAAELAIPDMSVDIRRMEVAAESMKRIIYNRINEKRLLLENQRTKLEKNNPERIMKEQKERLGVVKERLNQSMKDILEMRKNRYGLLLANLHGLSPTAKLVNGFGYISSKDLPVTSVVNINEGDSIHLTIHDGEVDAKVTRIQKVKFDS